jgi:23S rRNA pseudouridine1911/1915/1917 synthase
MEGIDVKFCLRLVNAHRLDGVLSRIFGMSRQVVNRMIKKGHVRCNGHSVKASHRVTQGDELWCWLETPVKKALEVQVTPNQIMWGDYVVSILHEDDDILILNKPIGLMVHGSKNGDDLVAGLIGAGISLAGGSGDRPGIVHRLDMYTEGVMVVAKSIHAYYSLKRQFQERWVHKRYYAVLHGRLGQLEGVVDRPIGRDASVRARQSCHHYVAGTQKSAITYYKVLNQLTNVTFVDVQLITGRTHQIRVHFGWLNCPVLGDFLYSGQRKSSKGYHLQSYALGFMHPTTQDSIFFEMPVSERLKKYKAQ